MSYHLSFGILLSCISHKHYLRFRDIGLNIAAVRYEDVISNPVESMRAVLEFCQLPTENVEQCRQALEFDSQKGTPLSSERLSRHPTLEYSGEARKEADAICEKFGLPHADQVYIAPGTITGQKGNAPGKGHGWGGQRQLRWMGVGGGLTSENVDCYRVWRTGMWLLV